MAVNATAPTSNIRSHWKISIVPAERLRRPHGCRWREIFQPRTHLAATFWCK
jgi:hypothetical protein